MLILKLCEKSIYLKQFQKGNKKSIKKIFLSTISVAYGTCN